MKVSNEIRVYEINGTEIITDSPVMRIDSHWNRNELIVVRIGEFAPIAVSANDLIRAVKNATNWK